MPRVNLRCPLEELLLKMDFVFLCAILVRRAETRLVMEHQIGALCICIFPTLLIWGKND